MTLSHSTQPATPRPDPFRWSRADLATALDAFSASEHTSQRAYAQQAGIPHATFNYWLRQHSPDDDDPIDCFFRSPAGELVLRRLLTAALVVFQQRGACGIRLLADFLQLSQLDRFVACSRGALQPLAAHLEAELVAFRDREQPALAQQMTAKTITLVADEHFHSGQPCLVGLEPVSGFLLVECYRDRRDADTWQEAIAAGTRGLPVQIVQLTSDLARALVCCAEKGLQAAHCPDLFHGQRDLLKPLLLPLTRPLRQAEQDLQQAQQHSQQLDAPLHEPCSEEEFLALLQAVQTEQASRERLAAAQQRQADAVQQVRGIGDDYHPFDRDTGQPVTAAAVGQRLSAHVDRLAAVVAAAGLGEKAKQAVNKSRTWLGTLMGVVAWFWCLARTRVEELALSAEQEQVVLEKLLGGHYWELASRRARSAAERARLRELAARLKQEAWQAGGVLSALPAAEQQQVQAVAEQIAGLFQRSSSCVEGRNGRLSLQHHGHSRVSEQRLKALTVLHNYLVKRPDGTTAAERFFGQKHQEVFSWLVEHMPDLPRPASKRPKPAA
jgi:hypothetical protein